MARVIAVADCETTPFKIGRVPRPFVWGYYDGGRYLQFPGTLERYLQYVDEAVKQSTVLNLPPNDVLAKLITAAYLEFLKTQAVICYAHNGGKFDWHFVLDDLTPYDDIMLINGRIARANMGMCELRDSYNILPVPLAEYKKDKIDYSIMEETERHKPKNWETICAYLKSDCVYLYELITGFVERYGVQITQASAAMQQWKKVSKRKLPISTREFYDLFSPYYYGGRVQCFESGVIDARFAVLDINSAYPYAMLYKHPYSTQYTHVTEYVEDADFYRVRCISHGAFPCRGLGRGEVQFGLTFPNDKHVEREYTVTGWEYLAAMETGTIEQVKVLESFMFAERVDFREYIEKFYQLRLQAKAEHDDAASLFAKLLMNSLYGKFAANPENYRNYIIVPYDVIPALESEGWAFAGELGPWALAEQPLAEFQERYYNVATGASITGFVRAMLWRAICSSKGVLYCDTDSIAVREMSRDLVLSDALGAWKHVGDFDRAGIAGKKLYIFRGVPDAKGVREYKTAAKGARLTNAQLWMVARGANVVYYSDAPTFSPKKAPAFVTRQLRFTAD